MDTPAVLARDLATLTAALAMPGADLGALLTGLSRRIRLVVPSSVGLSMTVVMDDVPITLTIMDGASVAASMRLPLSALGAAEAGSFVVLYAANAGAFVDLAADADFVVGAGKRLAVLDDDLHPTPAPGLDGLKTLSAINRAIGFLIGDGHTPAGASAELDRRALATGISRHAAALRVVGPTAE